MAVNVKYAHALVIGSGAAGLAAAVRLDSLGVEPVVLCTEGLHMGASINTGSDKQLYRALGASCAVCDSPHKAALDSFSRGAVHGDLAYTEASLAERTFDFLVNAGVPFAHDAYGNFAFCHTDGDGIARAASSGPHTSRDMSLALVRQLKRSKVELCEHRLAVALLLDGFGEHRRCTGALFVNTAPASPDEMFEAVYSPHTVLATGGPGGYFAESVYPELQTGSPGMALEAGAKMRNLPQFRFGIAATAFRRMLSGSYMQVVPRFVSCGEDLSDEREFLRGYFPSSSAIAEAVFAKSAHWAFDASAPDGASLIDLAVLNERTEKHRRVFLDFRRDPDDLDFAHLPGGLRDFFISTHSEGSSPIERLERLNRPASGAFRGHGFDLADSMLEAAVCVQHNMGGLACGINAESENLPGLYAAGESNGSHGLELPPGAALAAGQVWAFRAAEFISSRKTFPVLPESESQIRRFMAGVNRPLTLDWREERFNIQRIMSCSGGMVRNAERIAEGLARLESVSRSHASSGTVGLGARDTAEFLRNGSMLTACRAFLTAMAEDLSCGSRGGCLVDSPDGDVIHRALPWRSLAEDVSKRGTVQETVLSGSGGITVSRVPVRPVPESGDMFENVWRAYRLREYPRADGNFL